MIKKLFFALCVLAACLPATAQKWAAIGPKDHDRVAAYITKQVKSVKSLQCEFVQTKKSDLVVDDMKSEGKMRYAMPDKLHWEYVTPFVYAIDVNGDDVRLTKDGIPQAQKAGQKKMINGMAKMIVGMSSGNSLFDEKTFSTTIYENATQYKLSMIPKTKSIQRMFTSIDLIIEKRQCRICKLVMAENDKSQTTIEFKNVVTK